MNLKELESQAKTIEVKQIQKGDGWSSRLKRDKEYQSILRQIKRIRNELI